MRTIGCPEMSATKYQALLLNTPEEHRPHLSTVLASTQTTSALVTQDTVRSLQLFRPTFHGQWHTQEFCSGRGSTNSVEDKGQGYGGGSPLVRGSGGSCNFVEEISFHIIKS